MTSTSTTTSDFDKILSALTTISSTDDLFDAFGVGNLPQAQKYGILLGITTFVLTVSTVIGLLVFGGSFRRIVEQAENDGQATVPDAIEERLGRPLLLERLLECREWMWNRYVEQSKTTNKTKTKRENETYSVLTNLLLNVAPDVKRAREVMATLEGDGDDGTVTTKNQEKKSKKKMTNELNKSLPEGYENEYIRAYRKCQEKPGGSTLSGLPEARFEAYARAYAGCGTQTTTSYRRSYSRLYEAVSCQNHTTETTYRNHWIERPGDIIGRTVRLEPLEIERHLEGFYRITCGLVNGKDKGFDPNEVWGFEEEGPFETMEEMKQSYIFRKGSDSDGVDMDRTSKFAIIESVTDKMIGVVMLTRDDPKNLTVSLELPIVKPSSEGTVESIEACFLLVDRLFAHGYRRVQLSVDSMDTVGKKLGGRLGFTQEGTICKDRIVKEANRDSIVYGLLNSDWDKGARRFMFKKLHGDKAMKVDKANEDKEHELEVQQKFLDEKKAEEAEKKSKKL